MPTTVYHSHTGSPGESKSQEQNKECRFRSWRRLHQHSQRTHWSAKAAQVETDECFASGERPAGVVGGCEFGIWQRWTAKPLREANQRWQAGHQVAPGYKCNRSRRTAVNLCLFISEGWQNDLWQRGHMTGLIRGSASGIHDTISRCQQVRTFECPNQSRYPQAARWRDTTSFHWRWGPQAGRRNANDENSRRLGRQASSILATWLSLSS